MQFLPYSTLLYSTLKYGCQGNWGERGQRYGTTGSQPATPHTLPPCVLGQYRKVDRNGKEHTLKHTSAHTHSLTLSTLSPLCEREATPRELVAFLHWNILLSPLPKYFSNSDLAVPLLVVCHGGWFRTPSSQSLHRGAEICGRDIC